MKKKLLIIGIIVVLHLSPPVLSGQDDSLLQKASSTMLSATEYMVENVSTNGGYVWYYLPDFSRRWGEMEAYKTMIWLQHPGTISMGHLFLEAYHASGNKYYYEAAKKAANAIIWGQSYEGGWNYMIDFAGDRSLKQWYSTIGRNGWRLEEFQHYYGNSTFDDDITSDASRFLLRMYLEKMDPVYKPALEKAIDFILKSQYPLGGWPQRFPLKYDFNKQGHPDYSSFFTFNDDVIWENVHFLIQCYLCLGEEWLLDPINRGMNFYILSQDSSGGWGQQLTMDLKTAGARTYEPDALLPSTTFSNALLLLQFYRYTGEKKYLLPVEKAISWLEQVKLPEDKTDKEKYTHPTFVELGTNNPVYVHRKGSNVKYGYYYIDYIDQNLLRHYPGKCALPLNYLKEEYEKTLKMSIDELTKDSPLKVSAFIYEGTPQKYYDLNRLDFNEIPDEGQVKDIIESLDSQDRWLTKHAMISNPYCGDGVKQDPTDEFASTFVGDETDTSPYRDLSDKEYISTRTYIRNMYLLINYIKSKSSTINRK